MKGRTVLSIAHRLEAIKDSDMIICLAAPKEAEAEENSPSGKVDKDTSQKSVESQDEKKKEQARKGFTVVEKGTHAELFALGGVYAGLCNKQIESSAAALSSIPENSPADVTASQGDTCPQGHKLQEGMSPLGFGCDRCGESFPVGTKAYSCRTCNYDVCSKCMAKAKGQEEAPAQPAISIACINELRAMHKDLQAETLDELSQEALAVRLQALIGRIERNEEADEDEEGTADIAGNQAQDVKSSFRSAALKVIAANRFKSDELEEDDPHRYRSCRSAILTKQCSSGRDLGRQSSVKAVS